MTSGGNNFNIFFYCKTFIMTGNPSGWESVSIQGAKLPCPPLAPALQSLQGRLLRHWLMAKLGTDFGTCQPRTMCSSKWKKCQQQDAL